MFGVGPDALAFSMALVYNDIVGGWGTKSESDWLQSGHCRHGDWYYGMGEGVGHWDCF